MFWRYKPLHYQICIPPLQKPFYELTHEETEAYLQWHLAHLRERIDYLSETVSRELGVPRSALDGSPESLIPLWEWFLSAAKTERTPARALKHLEKQLDRHAESFRQYLLSRSKNQYSLETEYILRDIGMYLGEVFTASEPRIHWGYYEEPKSDFFVNMPVLLGFEDRRFTPPFKMEFEPIHMAHVQAAHLWDHTQKKEDLYNVYRLWADSCIPRDGPGTG